MPKSRNIEEDVEQIMGDFYEGKDDEEIHGGEFHDFYVIGGRFAGAKELCRYSEDKLSEFYKFLREKKVTVSGLQFGKQEIYPSSQIPMVDEAWNRFFPTENGETTPCPLFAHSNDQRENLDIISCDICNVDEIPTNLECERVIIAGPSIREDKLEAKYMICKDVWNGVNHMPIAWDLRVLSAIEMFEEKGERYRNIYWEKIRPRPDHICITIDYHL
jgi:hypothetical protein